MKNEVCRSCQASIFWIVTPNGKQAPVDVALSYTGKGWIETPRGWQIVHATSETPVHLSHFSTCPQGVAWRQKKTARPPSP